MPMEQEVMGMLIGGFITVIAISIVITATLWYRRKSQRRAYGWVLIHFIILALAGSFLLRSMMYDYSHPMASEEISLQLGLTGLIWAVSVGCLVMGLKEFGLRKES